MQNFTPGVGVNVLAETGGGRDGVKYKGVVGNDVFVPFKGQTDVSDGFIRASPTGGEELALTFMFTWLVSWVGWLTVPGIEQPATRIRINAKIDAPGVKIRTGKCFGSDITVSNHPDNLSIILDLSAFSTISQFIRDAPMRILAVDPGDKRIGLALSDPNRVIASPLTIIKHISRAVDAAMIVQIALDHDAGLVVIGQALDDEGQPTPQSRKSERLAEAIRGQAEIPVVLWDESGSTQMARSVGLAIGIPARRKRRSHGHFDELAATAILQDYLESNPAV